MNNFSDRVNAYLSALSAGFDDNIISQIECLARDLKQAWSTGKRVFICGNGGSAGNAIHMANDFHYGVGACGGPPIIPGIRVEALPANSAVLTCLANDTGYENIFSSQLNAKAERGDLLIALSGSGNSKNIVNALLAGREIGMRTFAILGFTGGTSKDIADIAIHFNVDDMQIAEDTQLIVGHICMQWLSRNKPIGC